MRRIAAPFEAGERGTRLVERRAPRTRCVPGARPLPRTESHRRQVALLGRTVEGRVAFLVPQVHRSVPPQQHLDGPAVRSGGRAVKRRLTQKVARGDVRPASSRTSRTSVRPRPAAWSAVSPSRLRRRRPAPSSARTRATSPAAAAATRGGSSVARAAGAETSRTAKTAAAVLTMPSRPARARGAALRPGSASSRSGATLSFSPVDDQAAVAALHSPVAVALQVGERRLAHRSADGVRVGSPQYVVLRKAWVPLEVDRMDDPEGFAEVFQQCLRSEGEVGKAQRRRCDAHDRAPGARVVAAGRVAVVEDHEVVSVPRSAQPVLDVPAHPSPEEPEGSQLGHRRVGIGGVAEELEPERGCPQAQRFRALLPLTHDEPDEGAGAERHPGHDSALRAPVSSRRFPLDTRSRRSRGWTAWTPTASTRGRRLRPGGKNTVRSVVATGGRRMERPMATLAASRTRLGP